MQMTDGTCEMRSFFPQYSLSVFVGYSDLVLLTKCLREIKNVESSGFNTTIVACVFDLVSIQNRFVAFLELKIFKWNIIYIMSPVCQPCWNLIWYRSIEFWVSSGLYFRPCPLPTSTTFPKKLEWSVCWRKDKIHDNWYSLRKRMCPCAVVGSWNKPLARIKKSVLPVKYHVILSNASIKSIQEWLCVCLGSCNAGLLNEIFEV